MKHSSLAIALACISWIGSTGCVPSSPAEPGAPGSGGGGGSAPVSPQPIACGSPALHAATHQVCETMDVASDGQDCHCMVGFYWDGSACAGLNGCGCVGTDCDKLTETEQECLDNHAGCSEPPVYSCGSPAPFTYVHDVCEPMDATGDGMCNCMIGAAWNGSACVGIAGCECLGSDCDKLAPTFAECEANHAACSGIPVISCGNAAMHAAVHDGCAAMDVGLVGMCDCMLGFVWDGYECMALAGGCECVGYDCDKVTETIEECQQAHLSCQEG